MPKQPKIEPGQIRTIKKLQKERGLDDDTYREMLRNGWGVSSCKALNRSQAADLIYLLHQGHMPAQPAPKPVATMKQIKMLRYYGLACGIHYADLPAHRLDDGRVLVGDDLRSWVVESFNLNRVQDETRPESLRLPPAIVRHLYDTWVNAKCNEFLVAEGYKKYVRAENKLYYEQLSPEAAEYLINRFRAIYQRLVSYI